MEDTTIKFYQTGTFTVGNRLLAEDQPTSCAFVVISVCGSTIAEALVEVPLRFGTPTMFATQLAVGVVVLWRRRSVARVVEQIAA